MFRSALVRRGSLFAVAAAILSGIGTLANSGGFHTANVRGGPAVPAPMPIPGKAPAISNASCSASACHGAPATDSILGFQPLAKMWACSASHWQTADPHAGTYSLLTDKATDKTSRPVKVRAESMMLRLGWQGPAREDVRCLACHTDPALASPGGGVAPASLARLRADGVGCQACHGQADSWLEPHTTGTLAGMKPLRDITVRATTCAGCHIGASDPDELKHREVTHDMIAAGHPRLTYEFAEHHRRLPKHWAEKTPGANHELRLWLVGQIVEAEAVCRQLADRAVKKTWPELAEFRCAACHHHLSGENSNAPRSLPGTPRWRSSWYLLTEGGKYPELEYLIEMMSHRKRPDSQEIRSTALKAANELKLRRDALAKTPDAALPGLLRNSLKAVPPDLLDGEDLIALLHALAAWERNRMVAPADPADFEAAYVSARNREWKELKCRLDGLRMRLEQAER